MADLILNWLSRYGDGVLIGVCLLVAAACTWYLMRREAPRRPNRRTNFIVNGFEFETQLEAEEYADLLALFGITPVVEWPEIEKADEPVGAADLPVKELRIGGGSCPVCNFSVRGLHYPGCRAAKAPGREHA